MERGSDRHGPRTDDVLKSEVEDLIRSGHESRGSEFREKEPAGEDEPDVDLAPGATLSGGTPPGMTERDVEIRSDIARYLHRTSFPAVREVLLDDAIESNAPDTIIDLVRGLPAGREFVNINDVAVALGVGVEEQRF